MANSFNTIQVRKPSKNTFDLTHDFKYSMQMGKLVPILVQEVLPGDSFTIQTETLIRFAPLVAPVMHNIRVFTHYFFVPNRIVWENWEDFISPDLSKEVPPARPTLSIPGDTPGESGTLWDYFGLPLQDGMQLDSFNGKVSALPFAAYNKIYNEYYRDQNLQDPVNDTLEDGLQNTYDPNAGDEYGTLHTRAWQHDYFTASLPFAQKGPSVSLPIGTFDDVDVYRQTDRTEQFKTTWTGDNPFETDPIIRVKSGEKDVAPLDENSLYAKTSELTANAATINDLRVAMRLQEWFEKAARGGSRYVEQLMVHWNVKSSDARLNRPEFIGGTRNPVIISEVLQTSETADTPQATMAGHGISAGSGKRIKYYAEEHGYIIGIQSIMPSTAYQQGLPRHFTRNSWEDYAWPTFAHLGEQAVLNQEIYYDNDGENEDTFGYIPRYSEYRYTPSRVAGEFRNTLSFWHMGRIFENRPYLNSDFIQCNPTTRIFAVTEPNEQNLWCHSYHKIYARRSLPKYGTPLL